MRGKSVANCFGSNAHEMSSLLVAAAEPTISISGALRESGLSVMEARSACDALTIAAQHPIALLVSNERLPDMSGPDLARACFEQHALHSVLLTEGDGVECAPYPTGVVARLCTRVAENVIPTICAVSSLARELRSARAREQELRTALTAEREINTAIGVLMERLQITRENAFERLRGYARSQRKRIVDVSCGLLGCAEESKRITAQLMGVDAAARNSAALDE